METININIAKCISLAHQFSDCVSLGEVRNIFSQFQTEVKYCPNSDDPASSLLREHDDYNSVIDYTVDFEILLSSVESNENIYDLFEVLKKTRMDFWTMLEGALDNDDLGFESVEELASIKFDNSPSSFALWLFQTFFSNSFAYHLEKIR